MLSIFFYNFKIFFNILLISVYSKMSQLEPQPQSPRVQSSHSQSPESSQPSLQPLPQQPPSPQSSQVQIQTNWCRNHIRALIDIRKDTNEVSTFSHNIQFL